MFELTPPTDKRGARRTLAAAMISIGRAEDPLAEFKARESTIALAMDLLGRDFSARRFLASCGFADQGFGADDGPAQLPAEAIEALRRLLHSDFGVERPALLAMGEVDGNAATGYEVEYTLGGGERHRVFAIEHDGHWVFAPGPVGREELDAVTRASRRHFELFIAMGLHLRGMSYARIEQLRDQIRPLRALWPDESDPYRACETHPLVFVMHNPVGHRRALFCSYDPMSDRAEAYDTDDPA